MDDSADLKKSRMQLFDSVAKGLADEYDKLRKVGLDVGLKGTAAENVLTAWMETWLPHRIGLRNGAILSMNYKLTTQRDCILFDHIESPIYHRFGDVVLLPIEGVLGAVELNYGTDTSYQKVLKDADKLSELGTIHRDAIRRSAVMYSHLARDVNPQSASSEEIHAGLMSHLSFSGSPVLLIFAEQLSGSLGECARRIMEHNKSALLRASVGGLFVLQQGYALHPASDGSGWDAGRQPGDRFAYLPATPGEVLLKLQSVILRHLASGGRVYPGGFDHYVSITGQGAKEVAASVRVSDDDYETQPDDPGYLTAQA